MQKTTILAVASAAAALATVASALAEECGEKPDTAETTTENPAAAPKGKRGRPAATGTAEEEPAPGKTGASVLTYEELREKIKPAFEAGNGEDIKKIVAKYSDSGLKGLPEDKQAAFLRDVDALSI